MKAISVLLPIVLAAGCGGAPDDGATSTAGGAPQLDQAIYTTFHPTTWMAEGIAGGLVDVVCPLPDGEDPIFWQPDRATLKAYAAARLVVVNGAELEKWVATASLAPSRVVDSASGFRDLWLHYAEATTHSHGGGEAHEHAGLDGHTWLDPILAQEQARAILDAMCAAFPAHADAFRANHLGVEAELADVHARLLALAPRLKEAKLIASHPAYNYLAARYGLSITNLDLDPEAPLDGEAIEALTNAMDAGRRNLLLWEGAPAAETLAAVPDGIRSVLVSPAENPGAGAIAAGEDLGAVLRANLERLETALQ